MSLARIACLLSAFAAAFQGCGPGLDYPTPLVPVDLIQESGAFVGSTVALGSLPYTVEGSGSGLMLIAVIGAEDTTGVDCTPISVEFDGQPMSSAVEFTVGAAAKACTSLFTLTNVEGGDSGNIEAAFSLNQAEIEIWAAVLRNAAPGGPIQYTVGGVEGPDLVSSPITAVRDGSLILTAVTSGNAAALTAAGDEHIAFTQYHPAGTIALGTGSILASEVFLGTLYSPGWSGTNPTLRLAQITAEFAPED